MGLFSRHIAGNIEIFDLSGNVSAVGGGIETGDLTQAAAAVDQRIPKFIDIVADAGKDAATGNYNSAFVQIIILALNRFFYSL